MVDVQELTALLDRPCLCDRDCDEYCSKFCVKYTDLLNQVEALKLQIREKGIIARASGRWSKRRG